MPAHQDPSTSRRWRHVVLILALAAAVPGRAYACSKVPFFIAQAPDLAQLIGTARADTVLAGPGRVENRSALGHIGPAFKSTIYGQVVDAERLGGLAAQRLPPGTKRVVLVPWAYGADCSPGLWTRSARWVEPGDRGFFTGVLRDREKWAGGLPTLDVFDPYIAPYPVRGGRMFLGPRPQPDSILTAEQYFELSNVLPTYESLHRLHADALVSLIEWARANPELARRIPARAIISGNLSLAEAARVQSIVPPIIGTYRFEAILTDREGQPDGTPRVFYVRTRSHADADFPIPKGDDWSAVDSLRVRRSPGYNVRTVGATSIDSFPVELNLDTGRREGWLTLLAEPERAGGREAWQGRVEVDLVARQFPADSALQQFARAARDESFQRYQANLPDPTDARFVRSPDGKIVVTQRHALADGRTLTLTGERTSEDVVKGRPWHLP